MELDVFWSALPRGTESLKRAYFDRRCHRLSMSAPLAQLSVLIKIKIWNGTCANSLLSEEKKSTPDWGGGGEGGN